MAFDRPRDPKGRDVGQDVEADDSRDRLKPYLIDRLTDDWLTRYSVAPGDNVPPANKVLTADECRDAVVRDLRDLLNTIAPPAWTGRSTSPLLETSVINYGLPDFAMVRLDDITGDRL